MSARTPSVTAESVTSEPVAPTDLGEVRGSARRRRWRRPLAILVVLVLLAVAGAWVVWKSPLLTVQTISVRGNTSLPPAQVRAAAQVPLGTPLAAVDADAVAERLRSLPRAGAVEVRRGFPRELVLVVDERVPVAVVSSQGTWRTVDADGREVAVVKARPAGLPRLAGSGPEGRTAALAVLRTLPPALVKQIDRIAASTRDDVELTLRSGDRVRWGDATSSERKATVLVALLTRPGSVYDVSAPDLPTVTE